MCFHPERIGLPFGLPSFLSGYMTGRSIKNYADAEIQKQAIAAAITGFITSDLPEDDTPFSDIQKDPISPTHTERDKQRNIDSMDIPISSMERLRNGENVSFNEPPSMESFGPFMESNLGFIAMSQGMTKEFYTGDFSKTNYSSARMAASINSLPASHLRKNVIQSQFLNKVVKDFLLYDLVLTKKFPMTIIDDMAWDYLKSAMPAVDPVKQSKSDEVDFKNGFRSMTSIMIDRGLNPEKEFARIKEEREKYADVFDLFKEKEKENVDEDIDEPDQDDPEEDAEETPTA